MTDSHKDIFFQTFYTAARKRGLLKEADHGLGKAEQIRWGENLYESRRIPSGILWESVELVLKIDNLKRIVRSLDFSGEETPEELSQNVDVALSLLQSNPHIEGVDQLLTSVHAQVQSYLDMIIGFSSKLDSREERLVDGEVDEAQTLIRNGEPAKALKVLKALFDTGPLLQVVGKMNREDSPLSAVAKLAADFEASKAHTMGTLTPQVKQEEIDREERILAHNLSMFSTFKIISNYCGLDPKSSTQRFEQVLCSVEKIPYDGSPQQQKNQLEREQVFKKELNTMMGAHSRFNVGFLNWIVFKLVKHFTNELSKSLVQNTQTAMLNPTNQPLKGHHGIVRGINNGILALLFAERIWKQDGTGDLGINEKELKMIQILEKLNGGSQEKLIKTVVNKALNEFPIGTFSKYRVLNGIATFFVKGVARGIVNRMKVANTVLETMSDAIYSDKHINYNIDALLLKQIQEFEKILGEDAAEMVIREGDNGKRLVSQFVENLFTLLRERGNMTSGTLQRQQESFLERLSSAMGEQTDNIIKGVVRDLLIFGYEQLNEKERMNQTLLDVLRQANRALRPSTASLLRELYSEQEGIDSLSEGKLVEMFENQHPTEQTKGFVSRQECEAALQEKYRVIEEELHNALGRILNATIKNVVVTQVQTHLKTPREAVLAHVDWLYEQFDPHQAYLQKKEAYTEEMKRYVILANWQKEKKKVPVDRDVQEKIDTRHKKLMIQLKNQLSLLKIKEGEDPSKSNLQIKRLYNATNQLIAQLEKVNQFLIGGDYKKTYASLKQLEQKMYELQGKLTGIRMTLDWDSLSFSEKTYETTFSMGLEGAKIATPVVRSYLNRWITPLAEESVAMYKSRAVFKAMVDQAVFRPYLEYQPSQDRPDHKETIAENPFYTSPSLPVVTEYLNNKSFS